MKGRENSNADERKEKLKPLNVRLYIMYNLWIQHQIIAVQMQLVGEIMDLTHATPYF